MPRLLSNSVELARHLIAKDAAFLLFAEIILPGKTYRLVKASRHVTAETRVWQACGFGFDPAEESASGDLSAFRVTIPNVSRLVFIESENGELLSGVARIKLGHESDLTVLTELVVGEIHQATIKEVAGVLTCGDASKSRRVPGRVFDRRSFPQIVAGRAGQL